MPRTATAPRSEIKPGLKFRSPLADGNPLWEVKRSRGRGVWECEVVNEPVTINGRTFPSDFAGTVNVFREQDIRAKLAWEGAFKKSADENANYYASLRLGQIVHYDNSFRNFVRCEVVMGTTVHHKTPVKCLKPIALVGDWRSHDLPKRRADGSIYKGHHATSIEKGECFEPHFGSIFESPRYSKGGPNPANLPAIDLSVPPMTPEEESQAKLWTAVKDASESLQDHENQNPRARLEAALATIQAALTERA